MERTAVFFDIDGTVLVWDKQVAADTAEAIRALRRNGHLAVINTGRPFAHIDPVVRVLGFDGYVCSCGAYLQSDGQEIRRLRHSAEVCREIIELVRRCRFMPIYESEDGMFFDEKCPIPPYFSSEREHYRRRGFDVDFNIDTPGFRFDKFCAFQQPDSDEAAFRAGVAPYFEVIGREHEMMEMPMKGCSKARGMRDFCELRGVRLEDSLAIGDGKNDLTMFAAAGHSAAMGDGDESAIEAAEFVSVGHKEGGVALALRHFGLI